jgi:hypothetical protein
MVLARCHLQSFSLSIHSRIYEAQFSSFTPSASQHTRKRTTSRWITPTSFRSTTMSRQSVWSSKSVLISVIACLSIRPLKMSTVNLPRAAVSILKVIDRLFNQRCTGGCACATFLPSEHRPQAVQPSSQLDLSENRAESRTWSDRILETVRILRVERGGPTGWCVSRY